MPVLIDSSLWVHQLRRDGDPALRARVNHLLASGVAAWCPPVRLELWRGAGGSAERKVLREYESTLDDLPITAAVWEMAIRLARRGRESGLTAPLADFLVFSCARIHHLELAHCDHHFDLLQDVRL